MLDHYFYFATIMGVLLIVTRSEAEYMSALPFSQMTEDDEQEKEVNQCNLGIKAD